MPGVAGFWCYVRQDDNHAGGRVRSLAERLRDEHHLQSASHLDLFIDRDVRWGEEWRARIDEALQRTTFFIPIITPGFFESEECRRELIEFVGQATSLGVQELLLPIYYVTVPGLEEDEPADEAMAIIKRTQWEDLRDVRLRDETDPPHRASVAKLAERLIEIAKEVEGTDSPISEPVEADKGTGDSSEDASELDMGTGDSSEDTADDDHDLLDRMAAGEEAMPKVLDAMDAFTTDMNELTAEAKHAASEADGAPTFAARLAVANKLAKRLEAPAEQMEKHAQEYVSLLSDVDPGILAMIRLAGEQPESEREAVEEFFTSIRGMTKSGRESAEEMKRLVAVLDEASRFSRELRRPLRRIQVAVKNVADAQAILDRWDARINEV
jgi:TIR domain